MYIIDIYEVKYMYNVHNCLITGPVTDTSVSISVFLFHGKPDTSYQYTQELAFSFSFARITFIQHIPTLA